MRILVTGGQGQVGNALSDQGKKLGLDLIVLNRSELDITNIRNVDAVFSKLKPDLVINAAAYTAVDKAESDSAQAYAINELGPKLLANACKRLDIPLLHISTDYVFDGLSMAPYEESDLPNPQSVYGRSKLMGEIAVSNILSKHIILRTSWVFGMQGNNFVKTIVHLAKERDRLTVVADQFGGPTSAQAIARTLLKIAVEYENTGAVVWGTYHFCQKPYVSWHQFAEVIIERAIELGLVGHKIEVEPIPSSSFPTPVKRPTSSRLNTTKLESYFGIPNENWIEGLNQVLKNIAKKNN